MTNTSLSRRNFLLRVGQAGGYSAAFLAMRGMGLMATPIARAESITAAAGSGKGTKVAVLGGGIAGLVSAYELRALGYDVTLLEARARPGGRNWTVRGGDTVELLDGSKQKCEFGPGLYQNLGPARLPSIHTTILGYCRKFGIELQVEVNMSYSARLQNDAADGGKPVAMRQALNDTRGHVSELLAKCVNQGALDAEISASDKKRMLDFLQTYGELEDGKYKGCDRAGYAKKAGAGDDAGVLSEPLDMHMLLDADFWDGMLFDQEFDQQATMFQPVGGMDRIPYAFAKELGHIIKYSAPVTGIRRTAKGVRIGYREHGAGKSLDADYCICAMPLTALKKMPNDFSAPFKKVIDECTYAHNYKIAWESRRFWEMDDNVYGGLEFVNTGVSPVWFPSAGLFSERGVMVCGYADEALFPKFAALDMPAKFAESRKSVERLHPGHGKELEKPMYVGWGKVEYNEGAWIDTYGPNGSTLGAVSPTTGQPVNGADERLHTNPGYETLIQADGPFLFAGDHVSHLVGWQEGAALSAVRAVNLIAEHVKAGA